MIGIGCNSRLLVKDRLHTVSNEEFIVFGVMEYWDGGIVAIMGKYATYLDLGVTRIEEYKLDLFPFLDPTLPRKNRELRQYSSTDLHPYILFDLRTNTPPLHHSSTTLLIYPSHL